MISLEISPLMVGFIPCFGAKSQGQTLCRCINACDAPPAAAAWRETYGFSWEKSRQMVGVTQRTVSLMVDVTSRKMMQNSLKITLIFGN
jgi:hypothetical protein